MNLYQAAYKGNLDKVRSLINSGADVNPADELGVTTPLWAAAQNGHLEVTRLLLDRGANANLAGEVGANLLWAAARNGHLKVVRLLLDRGANANLAGGYGGPTPLYMAAYNGHSEVARLLIDRGANVDLADRLGYTPLWAAARSGHLDVVRLLLQHGAKTIEPETKVIIGQSIIALINDTRDWTPLHWAVDRGDIEACVTLIENGVDPNKEAGTNNFKCSPLDLVKKKLEGPFYGLFDTAPKTKEALIWYPKDVKKAINARALLLESGDLLRTKKSKPHLQDSDSEDEDKKRYQLEHHLNPDVWSHVFPYLAPAEGKKDHKGEDHTPAIKYLKDSLVLNNVKKRPTNKQLARSSKRTKGFN